MRKYWPLKLKMKKIKNVKIAPGRWTLIETENGSRIVSLDYQAKVFKSVVDKERPYDINFDSPEFYTIWERPDVRVSKNK